MLRKIISKIYTMLVISTVVQNQSSDIGNMSCVCVYKILGKVSRNFSLKRWQMTTDLLEGRKQVTWLLKLRVLEAEERASLKAVSWECVRFVWAGHVAPGVMSWISRGRKDQVVRSERSQGTRTDRALTHYEVWSFYYE